MVAVPGFRGLELLEMKLYPIELWHKTITGDGRAQRGTPRMASKPLGRKIIERVAGLSAPFGTRIFYRERIGLWPPSGTSESPPN